MPLSLAAQSPEGVWLKKLKVLQFFLMYRHLPHVSSPSALRMPQCWLYERTEVCGTDVASAWTSSWLRTPQAFSRGKFETAVIESALTSLQGASTRFGLSLFQKKWWRSWRPPSWIWWSSTAARLTPTFTQRRRAAAARRRCRRPASSTMCCPSTCMPPTASPSPGLPGTATRSQLLPPDPNRNV